MNQIGTTDLHAYPLILGTNTFGFTADETAAHSVLDAFVASGGNMIDTADEYTGFVPGNRGGEAETMIGTWLSKRSGRDDVIITTKVSQHPEFRGLSARNIAAAAQASLGRLGTDHLDVYYAHFDDAETPLVETAAAFDALVRAGTVRYIGVSNYSGARIQEWIDIARAHGFASPALVQPHYNLLNRDVYEREIAPVVETNGLGAVPYFGLASGVLTGKYRSERDLVDADRALIIGAFDFLRSETLPVVELVREIGEAHSTSAAAVSLAWLRSRANVAAPIVSARTVEQLADLTSTTGLVLTDSDLDRLDRASAGLSSMPRVATEAGDSATS